MNSETLNSFPKSSSTSSLPCAPPSHFDHVNRLQPMPCSFPTTAKSNWLHRLRSSKGFPHSDHINLEHFLSNSLHKVDPQAYKDSSPPDKKPHLDDNIITEQPHDNEAVQGREVMSNVLSDLFHMGDLQDSSKTKRQKSCRKQRRPRICVISTNSDVHNVPVRKGRASSTLPVTFNNRRKPKEVGQELKVREHVQEEEEEEKGNWDLSAYSQTEVTVIDTSVPSWKFEKMLFRRKNVWKVGDKKGKGLMSGDRKKRKESLNESIDAEKKKLRLCGSSSKSGDEEEGREEKKMMKKKKKRLKACNSSKHADKQEAMVRTKSIKEHDHGKMIAAAYEKKQDISSQVQEKSFFKKQTDGGSSVILVKSIPTTNKKVVSGIPKSCVKSLQK